MNKKAKRKAFFICLAICLMYISLTVKITERFNMTRISQAKNHIQPSSIVLSDNGEYTKKSQTAEITPNKDIKETESTTKETLKEIEADKAVILKRDDDYIEPMFFMSVPIVCHLIKNRIIEQDILVPSRGNTWKKPIQILQEKDTEGLKNISRIVNRKDVVDLLKKEGIEFKEQISTEDLIAGRGYVVNKARFKNIYEAHVGDGYDVLFPISLNNMMIKKTGKGFEFIHTRHSISYDKNDNKAEKEWVMPNLSNIPMRSALEKINVNTSKIKIIGMGNVYDQSPKPQEIVKGEVECILYGRLNN
ncbi:MAG TPA: hypothetical protein PKW07_08250 [Syntrophorhabdaceae bacterium]|nr:hypothetical protein [Syntrophorhabdaceae bacterium]